MGDWKVKFLSSGSLTIYKLGFAKEGSNIFLVGDGNKGSKSEKVKGCHVNAQGNCMCGVAGGQGGSCTTEKGILIKEGGPYTLTVGVSAKSSKIMLNDIEYSFAGGCGAVHIKRAGSWGSWIILWRNGRK